MIASYGPHATAGEARSLWERGLLLVFAAALLFGACANPVAPSGGPRDTTPPRVVRSLPPSDTVNVPTSTRRVRLEFSEYVERNSLQQALSVTPSFERQLEYDWDGRDVEVVFPATLRDSTTYILSLSTDLQDTRGVSLEEPITIAFATGPRINQGTILGRVVEPGQGEPLEDVDVYAYDTAPGVAPDSLPDRPAYKTQTGSDGAFTFRYMREQHYYVVALRDGNRNRRPDPGEAFAPPPRPALDAGSTGVSVPTPWLLATADTTRPDVRGAQGRTARRVTVRFSEPVRFPTRTLKRWTLQDSTRQTEVPVNNVYIQPDTPTEVVLRTGAMRASPHRLVVADSAVADTLGQPIRADTARFQAVTRADTLQTRFNAFGPSGLQADSLNAYPLLPGVRPTVSFNQAPGASTIQRAASVRDTTGAPLPATFASEDGTEFTVTSDTAFAAGRVAEVVVDGSALGDADTTYVQRYRRLTSGALGELEGRVVLGDTTLGSAPDSLLQSPTSPDTARADSLVLPADTTQADSIRTDSIRADSIRTDTLRADTLQADTVRTDTLQTDSVQVDTVRTDSVRVDSIRADSVRADSVQGEAQADSIQIDGVIVVELVAEQSSPPVSPRTLTTLRDSAFVFSQLPEGRYRFRAFVDRNGNGRWDPGLLVPYRAPEPITWSAQPTSSRKRWTTVLPQPLRIVLLRE